MKKRTLSRFLILFFLIFANCAEREVAKSLRRAYHTAVWTGREMIVWGGYDGENYINTGGRYNPEEDKWVPMSIEGAPAARAYHTAVWTGREMIVWGGHDGKNYINTGGRYNPEEDKWVPMSIEGAPTARAYHTAVWTGREMIVWGGHDAENYINTGGRYDPETDSWGSVSTEGAPKQRIGSMAVWTGKEMVILGGVELVYIPPDIFPLNSSENFFGGKYDPESNLWHSVTAIGAPDIATATGVWTGKEVIVWGDGYNPVGGRYDPETDKWIPMNTESSLGARFYYTVVWTGTEMIAWGGYDDNQDKAVNTGSKYNPEIDRWIPISTADLLEPRAYHTAVWTGREMIVWGGKDKGQFLDTGWRYNNESDTWIPMVKK